MKKAKVYCVPIGDCLDSLGIVRANEKMCHYVQGILIQKGFHWKLDGARVRRQLKAKCIVLNDRDSGVMTISQVIPPYATVIWPIHLVGIKLKGVPKAFAQEWLSSGEEAPCSL